jgi:thiol-disulfide isomerase/thioredoxin
MALKAREEKRELAASDAAASLTTSPSSAKYTDFAGNPADLEQYVGQVLLVNSWASWSPFSAAELTLLAETAETYAAQGVVVIAINRAEVKSSAESYLKTIGVGERVKLIMDTDDNYYESIGGYTMPETLIYDRKGNVIAHKRGSLTKSELLSYVEEALASE